MSNENWRDIIKVELSPEEQIEEEVKLAILNHSLNDYIEVVFSGNKNII